MPSLFSLFVDLKANTADFVSGMSSASYAAKKTGRDIESSFSTLGGLAEKALAPLGQIGGEIGSSLSGIAEAAGRAGSSLAAGLGSASLVGTLGGMAAGALAAAGAMTELAIKGSEVVESFARISQKTGISISDLQTFGAAGESVGVSLDDVVAGMRKFDQVLTNTGRGGGALQATLKSLGITATDNKGALLQLADAFAKMEDGPRKDAIAIQLLGRSGLNLIPILDQGRAGIEQFQSIVDEFGPKIGSGAISATEAWKKSTLELDESWKNTEVTLTTHVLPVISSLTESIALMVKDMTGMGEFLARINDSQSGQIVGGMKLRTPISGKNADVSGSLAGMAPNVDATFELNQYQQIYEELEAGGKTQLALKQMEATVAEEVQVSAWQEAAADEAKVTSLKQILALEEQRKKIYDEIDARIGTGALAHPTLAAGPLSVTPGAGQAWDENQKRFVTTGGPGSWQAAQLRGARAPVAAPDVLGYGTQTSTSQTNEDNPVAKFSSAATDFWKQYGDAASNTLKQIDDGYEKSYSNFYDLLQQELSDTDASDAQKLAAQQQFTAISAQLERDRLKSIADLRKAQDDQAISDPLNLTSFSGKFKAFADQMQIEGQNLGPKLFSSMTTAVGGLEDQLAKLVVTGKANFRQLFDSFAESVAKAGFQSIFGKIFGIGKSGSAAGSSANAPGGTPGIVSGSLGIGGAIGKALGLDSSSSGSSSGGGFGGILSAFAGLGSLVGLAGGGDMEPGRAYLVGEKGPELMFAGRQGGTIVPMSRSRGGHTVHNHININGVSDFDSFRKSSSQVMASIHRQTQIALARSG